MKESGNLFAEEKIHQGIWQTYVSGGKELPKTHNCEGYSGARGVNMSMDTLRAEQDELRHGDGPSYSQLIAVDTVLLLCCHLHHLLHLVSSFLT